MHASIYWPISLTCILCKVFEKLLYIHLYTYVHDNLSLNQHGFVHGKSCLSKILETVSIQEIRSSYTTLKSSCLTPSGICGAGGRCGPQPQDLETGADYYNNGHRGLPKTVNQNHWRHRLTYLQRQFTRMIECMGLLPYRQRQFTRTIEGMGIVEGYNISGKQLYCNIEYVGTSPKLLKSLTTL